ncbi:DUF4183 domain-containing protein [Paenibacillus psychroresistens]|uniref:DUF4183 domain-containing protein n=1 Tax=Paenibacillus psychroresistens TaxID=1778678 RepID=A0A6B8RK98_9BACL|nr:DUF4183 domain-containing protein [Paenibacillus psychroresistens]QGQ96022.1 DUF4183 domain-containing protein [Paenibacillus psychroresistens]
MALDIIDLYLSATSVVSGGVTTASTTVSTPTVKRFASTVIIGNISGGVTTILATAFRNDSGTLLPAGGLTVPTSSGYYNLFVNGILQLGGMSTLTNTSLVVNSALILGVSVVIEVVNLTAATTSTSTHNLTVATTIHS